MQCFLPDNLPASFPPFFLEPPMRMSHWFTVRSQSSRKPARGLQLRVECLEDRCIPATLMVTSTADMGTGSLRDAIGAAASGDTIRFDTALSGQTITLAGQLDISKSLNISGAGLSAAPVLNGNQVGRIFNI